MTKTAIQVPAFTPTQWDSADQKAKFYKQFIRFVEGGMTEQLFPKWFYTRLSMCFHHIAHYDQGGFFSTWFSTPQKRIEFLKNTMDCQCCGQPEFTYCDVERVLQDWLASNPSIVERYMNERDSTIRSRELDMLKTLSAKYPGELATLSAPAS